MCGRFCCSLNPEELRTRLYNENILKHRNVDWIDEKKHRASYNVCPARYIPTVLQSSEKSNERVMKSMRWGFIAPWAKTVPAVKPINARFETLTESPNSVFHTSKNSKRCVIVAEGFFEWNKKKQTFYIKRRDGQMMLFAGLYSNCQWDEQEEMTTCTIITTIASKFFSKIHNRMPVILDIKDIDKWLDKNQVWDRSVVDLLKPFNGNLDCFQVTNKVGQTKNDYPDLIVPIDQQKSSISQFLKPMDLKKELNKDLPTPALKKEEAATGDSKTDFRGPLTSFEEKTKKRRRNSDASDHDHGKKSKGASVRKAAKITNYFAKGAT